jgi:hypothetical protein
MYGLLKFWKGKKSILGKTLNFFTIVSSDFLIFIYPCFKKYPTLEETPKSHFTPPFNKISYSYFIFNLKIVHHYFKFNNLCFELIN